MRSGALLCALLCSTTRAEVWQKDMSDEVYIEASHEGFTAVELVCTATNMEVTVHMEEDFDGIIYTRGSYMSKLVLVLPSETVLIYHSSAGQNTVTTTQKVGWSTS